MTARYTLWTIPRSAWTELPIEITPEEQAELVEFARTITIPSAMQKRINAFDTMVDPDTWHKVLP